MNVVIYARYSSHSQTEQSIEGQIAVCTEYAKRNNYTIVGEYIDRALTGTNDNRPQFKQMIEDSNKKYFQGVLVYQLDRFARNRYDSATYKNKLKKNNVRVFSAKENISDDASGVLMESVLEGMAEYYSVELSQKVKRGMLINAQKCLYNGSAIPLGLKIGKDKKYKIDNNTAPIIQKIFDMYANGYIMADIINYLNERNIKTSKGNDFNKNSIRRILENEKYIGTYTYGDIKIENGIPKIINKKLFDKVQEQLKKNKKTPARAKAKTNYLLTTKLFCGTCKEMMVGVSGTSKTGKTHNYYSCNGKKKKSCNRKNVQKDFIENLIITQARNILTDNYIGKIANMVVQSVKKEEKSNNIISILENQLKENEKQKINLFDSLKICDIDSVRKEIFTEIQKIQEEHEMIQTNIIIEKSRTIIVTEDEVVFFLKGLQNGNINDIRYKKLLINVLVDRVYLYDNNLTIIFNTNDINKVKEISTQDIEKIESSFIGSAGTPKNELYKRVHFLNIGILFGIIFI